VLEVVRHLRQETVEFVGGEVTQPLLRHWDAAPLVQEQDPPPAAPRFPVRVSPPSTRPGRTRGSVRRRPRRSPRGSSWRRDHRRSRRPRTSRSSVQDKGPHGRAECVRRPAAGGQILAVGALHRE
jgi:hypothetical protein